MCLVVLMGDDAGVMREYGGCLAPCGRGALLLELLISLAIFVAASLTVLSMVRQTVADARAIDDRLHARDLAYSSAARLIAGVSTVERESGPAPEWRAEMEGEIVEDLPPEESEWEISIESSRAGFGDLSLLRITASRALRIGVEEAASVQETVSVLVAAGRFRESDALPEDEIFREFEALQGSSSR